ncbi:MAG TPA: methylated-DNA--[protein]-cysteine S-methyltransferase [Pseudonocardiaceae bacterium]|nr:methylated-DNA--[protein]-cysteine S-methyltransferase [Pseudonocardiaceae bacterium]
MTTDQPPVVPIPHDPLAEGLAALAASGPPGVLERIAARWSRVPGPPFDLYIASTHLGVVYVRTSDAVHHDDREFADLFHRRFAQPLLAGDQPAPSNRDRADRIRFDLSRLGTFEREVLLAVLTIPRGQVRPYDWIAGNVGPQATAYRVDVVLRDNPIPVLIPCHRVINADGTLGEHVLGQHVKQALLAAEGTNVGEVYALAQLDIRYVASDATGMVCFPTCWRARTARTGFPTVTRARAAGYRPCPECRPAPDEAD